MNVDACGKRFELVERDCARDAPRRLLASHAAQFGELPMLADMYQAADGIELDLGEFGAFRAGAGQRDQIEVLRWPARESLREEFLYGPVLLSALAARGIYALHASAFRLGAADAPVVAVIAPSGTGKSTLARAAHLRGWQRLSDDLLPTTIDAAARPLLLPHFPQLKLPAEQQYPRDQPAVVALSALIVLERAGATTIAPLPPRDAMHTVLSSTISSRLFPPAVLQEHLRFASAIAAAVARGDLEALRLSVREDRDAPATAADQALSMLEAAIGATGARQ